jgi:zinc ribbon protein
MPSLFKRLRKGGEDAASAAAAPAPPRRRRYLPPPSRLRRERRALLSVREQRIHDLGGLVLEMYRQDRFRQDVVHEEAAQIVALEERVREVDRLLTARTRRTDRNLRCARCGTPLYHGARFCPSCGQALEPAASP